MQINMKMKTRQYCLCCDNELPFETETSSMICSECMKKVQYEEEKNKLMWKVKLHYADGSVLSLATRFSNVIDAGRYADDLKEKSPIKVHHVEVYLSE